MGVTVKFVSPFFQHCAPASPPPAPIQMGGNHTLGYKDWQDLFRSGPMMKVPPNDDKIYMPPVPIEGYVFSTWLQPIATATPTL